MTKMNKALNKTNVKLTGNIKLVITHNKWYLESIDSSRLLETSNYKGYEYNSNLNYHTNLYNFINSSNKSNLFDVKKSSHLIGTNEVYNQYHDLYNFGCYSEESQLIDENMRFFAPISIMDTKNTPDLFVIMKSEFVDNSLQEKINDGKVVEVYDLSEIKKSIFSKLSECYISTDFKQNISVRGFDINNGQYNTYVNNDLSDFINIESAITEFDNWITNSYSRNNLIYTNIVNLEFAFTDKEVDGKFMKYYGFYCNKNEIEFSECLNYPNTLRLIKTENEYIKFDPDYTLNSYTTKELSAVGNAFGRLSVGVVEFDFKVVPQLNSVIQIINNELVDYNLVLRSELLTGSIDEVKENIVDEINNNFTGNTTTIRAEILENKSIRLYTNNILDDFDSIRLYTSSNEIKIINPVLSSNNDYNGEFVFSDKSSVLSNQYFSDSHFDYIMYIKDGVEVYDKIERTYRYLGQYLYKLSETIENIKPGSTFWFSKDNKDTPYILSILDSGILDMNTEISDYEILNDFELDKFKSYLLKIVNRSDYYGNVLEYFNTTMELLTLQQLLEYKNYVTDIIDSYFDVIELQHEYLIRDINPVDYSYTTVKNEYDRLVENRLPSLKLYNRLYQFINKWTCGFDSNNNPNRLNIALPFGEESFNASHFENRLKASNTHDYFISIDGIPEYFKDVDVKNLSYSKIPLDLEDFKDTEIDAYEWLSHQSLTSELNNIGIIEYDPLQKTSSVYFKGVKYNIGKNLDNYRFSVVLKSSIQVIDDVFNIEYVQNDTFKTFTIYIEFYVPDPVLTTLERGDEYYFLDKSLLYFSGNLYTTIESSVDFGQDQISLDLYNTSTDKLYLGTYVTNNWYYTLPNNQDIIYVGRGNIGIFNTKFSDILSIGDDLTITYKNHYNYSDPFSPWYGMEITFVDVVDVHDNYFWCKEIIVKSNLLDIPAVDWDLDNDIADEFIEYNVLDEFKLNNNIFNTNNTIYISKAIAYDLSKYDKIINQKANEARYNEISLASIKNYLKLNNLYSGEESVTVNIYDYTVTDINISNRSDGSNIVGLSQPYKLKIGRQHLKYTPQINDLQSWYGNSKYENIFPYDEPKYKDYIKIISKVTQEYLDSENTKLIEIPRLYYDSEIYEYIRTANNEIIEVKLPWLIAPNEIRNYNESIVMNTSEKLNFIINIENEQEINLVVLLKDYVSRICKVNSLSNEELIKFMNIYYSVDSNTLNNYNPKEFILERFINNLFTKIYRVEEVKTSSGTLINNYINNINLILDKEYTDTITVKFTR